MNKYIIWLATIIALFSSCNKKEIIDVDLEGSIHGSIILYGEFFNNIDHYDGVLVQLEGNNLVLSTTTDSSGYYKINNIPTGIYIISYKKSGYDSQLQQGLKIVGGETPVFFEDYLIQSSTTKVNDLKFENHSFTGSFHVFTLSAFVTNENIKDVPVVMPLQVKYFIDSTGNPSINSYLRSRTVTLEGEPGSQMTLSVFIPNSCFNKNNETYVVLYGYNETENGYYDIPSRSMVLDMDTIKNHSEIVKLIKPL